MDVIKSSISPTEFKAMAKKLRLLHLHLPPLLLFLLLLRCLHLYLTTLGMRRRGSESGFKLLAATALGWWFKAEISFVTRPLSFEVAASSSELQALKWILAKQQSGAKMSVFLDWINRRQWGEPRWLVAIDIRSFWRWFEWDKLVQINKRRMKAQW